MKKTIIDAIWLVVILFLLLTLIYVWPERSDEKPEVNPGSKFQFHQVIITAKEVEISNDLQNARFISKEITHLHEQIREVLDKQSFSGPRKYSFPIERQYWCGLEDVTLISDYFKLLGFKVEFSRVGEEDGKVGTFNLTLDR